MKKETRPALSNATGHSRAFSLFELLVVMMMVGLLAAMVLPAVSRTKVEGKKQTARLEIAQIVNALSGYQSLYGRFPVSAEVREAASLVSEDMTYGGRIEETGEWLAGPCFMTDNSELMAGLLDLEYFGDGTPTINLGHLQNPQRAKFLEARVRSGTNAAPGIGIDGVYRDPWGSPYLVTLDLNGDRRARDVMYRRAEVSRNPKNLEGGLCGSVKGTNAQGVVVYEMAGPVLVWSAGPDRHVSTLQKANEGANRDNLLSCKR